MKIRSIIPVVLIFCFSQCSEDSFDQIQNEDVQAFSEDCPPEEIIKEKEVAENAITGKWEWVKTTYTGRGSKEAIETPLSTDKEILFEFDDDQLNVFENGNLIRESDFRIEYWEDGTNIADEPLTILYSDNQTGEFNRSILFLNSSATCLKLVNSYNDAGGDLYFKSTE